MVSGVAQWEQLAVELDMGVRFLEVNAIGLSTSTTRSTPFVCWAVGVSRSQARSCDSVCAQHEVDHGGIWGPMVYQQGCQLTKRTLNAIVREQ